MDVKAMQSNAIDARWTREGNDCHHLGIQYESGFHSAIGVSLTSIVKSESYRVSFPHLPKVLDYACLANLGKEAMQ